MYVKPNSHDKKEEEDGKRWILKKSLQHPGFYRNKKLADKTRYVN